MYEKKIFFYKWFGKYGYVINTYIYVYMYVHVCTFIRLETGYPITQLGLARLILNYSIYVCTCGTYMYVLKI